MNPINYPLKKELDKITNGLEIEFKGPFWRKNAIINGQISYEELVHCIYQTYLDTMREARARSKPNRTGLKRETIALGNSIISKLENIAKKIEKKRPFKSLPTWITKNIFRSSPSDENKNHYLNLFKKRVEKDLQEYSQTVSSQKQPEQYQKTYYCQTPHTSQHFRYRKENLTKNPLDDYLFNENTFRIFATIFENIERAQRTAYTNSYQHRQPFQKITSDPYKILGISRNASPADITKAYRKLAMKFHPDKNKGDPNAAESFKKISEAYRILSK